MQLFSNTTSNIVQRESFCAPLAFDVTDKGVIAQISGICSSLVDVNATNICAMHRRTAASSIASGGEANPATLQELMVQFILQNQDSAEVASAVLLTAFAKQFHFIYRGLGYCNSLSCIRLA